MLHIYIDGDACPVKKEVYRVAERFGLRVTLVANSKMWYPDDERIDFVLVENKFDAADQWIEKEVQKGDVVITNDIPLADAVIKKEAAVITPNGKSFTKHNIGAALAHRELMERLRETTDIGGGPPPFEKSDRSRFLQRLDLTIKQIQRGEEITY